MCAKLGYPQDFADRPVSAGQPLTESVEWITNHRPKGQNHWPGLALAFIAQAEELLAAEGVDSLPDVFMSNPPETGRAGARTINTMNITRSDGGESSKLRPHYNNAMELIKYTLLRNFPSSPGHATQSWPAYRPLVGMIFAMSPGERRALAEYVWTEWVLPLPEFQIAQVRDRVVRPFELVLAKMPTVGPKIPGGAMLQALTYGYLLADSPNLILESHSVNTGSARAKMLGDVDGFRGNEPELAAEVKDMELNESNVEDQLGGFLEDLAAAPNATAVVVCKNITDDGRAIIEKRNITVLTVSDLIRTVSVWDLPKQQEALRGVDYYLGRIQKSKAALNHFRSFLEGNNLDGGMTTPADESKASVEDTNLNPG